MVHAKALLSRCWERIAGHVHEYEEQQLLKLEHKITDYSYISLHIPISQTSL